MIKFKDEASARKVFNCFDELISSDKNRFLVMKKFNDKLVEINNLNLVTLTILHANIEYSISQLSIKIKILNDQIISTGLLILEEDKLDIYNKDLECLYFLNSSIENIIAERKNFINPFKLYEVNNSLRNSISNYDRFINNSIRRKNKNFNNYGLVRLERIKRLCYIRYKLSNVLEEMGSKELSSIKKKTKYIR